MTDEEEQMSEEEPEEEPEEEINTKKPRFAIVELSQLEKLLQHCPNCGKLPGGRSSGHNRDIN